MIERTAAGIAVSRVAQAGLKLVGLLVLSSQFGCFRASPPTHYYSLEAASSDTIETPSPRHYLSVGPLTVAPYLNQKQLVLRRGEHLVELSEFEQWAEPLESGIGTALATTISDRMKDRGVLATFSDIPRPESVSVPVSIERFDVGPDGTARIVAVWSILHEDGTIAVPRQRSILTQPGVASEPAASVGALSSLVTSLGDRISNELRGQPALFPEQHS